MKLIIQIPCFNEEKTLPVTLKNLPRRIDGIDEIEILIINDGSTDKTVEVAKEMGVNHIVSFKKNKGLARSFMAGISTSLKLRADVIVNTDADNQYKGEDIPKLIKPIVEKKADIVIGARKISKISHFSFTKKFLQKFGSWTVRQISGTNVPDVTCGFRAINKEAAIHLNLFSDFTYTLETIIQAGKKGMVFAYIPIETNEKTRESRLSGSIWHYIKLSISTIIRIYTVYYPLKVFSGIGGILCFMGLLIVLRFIYFYFKVSGPTGHTQSLIIAAILIILGFQILVIGLIAELLSANRKLLEDCLYRVKIFELSITSEEEIKRLRSRRIEREEGEDNRP
jgi:glycosyltransferase involved in cell wall biosynthesis